MAMKKIALIPVIIICTAFLLKSQNEVDALRYSRTTFGGTARSMSMAGAFGALGADFSTLSSNPAGIGLYKKSEITFTPSLYFGNTTSKYNGSQGKDSKTNFNVSNAGIVFSTPANNRSSSVIKYLQFGIGMNRLNNFNNRMLMIGYNDVNSYVDTYIENANGIDYQNIENDPYGEYAFDLNLAWYDYLIDTIPGTTDQYWGAVASGINKLQRKEVNSWGSMNEFLFAFGANIGDRLYLGTSFAFPYIRYFEESYYIEEDNKDLMDNFRSMQLYQELDTRGGGFNIKFGMIYRINDWVRFGGAIHSPTWFNSMTDYWYTALASNLEGKGDHTASSPQGNYDYDLKTPWRAMGSIAFIVAKTALLSMDYEFVDYSKASLSTFDYGFYNENDAIKYKYNQSHNIRVGGEYKIDNFGIRAGYAFYGSPFKSGINDGKKNYFTGGVGYRDKYFFIDLAYVYSISEEDYYLYGSDEIKVNPVQNRFNTNNILLTLGLRY
jgi:hypothetical protein